MPPRRHITLAVIAIATFLGISFLLTSGAPRDDVFDVGAPPSDSVLHGIATAPKLENATLK
jgi:hypothetical protein